MAVAASVAVYVVLGVYADFQSLRASLRSFPWQTVPVILLLTLGNYGGRLVKWHWYLRLVGSQIRPYDSARVFGVGMTMVLTPGKAGELLKAYMVRNVAGTPMRLTTPAVLAERLTDGLAMALLGGLGLLAYGDADLVRVIGAAIAVMVAAVVIVQFRPFALFVLGLGARLPLVRPHAASVLDFYESSYVLLRPRILLVAVLIGCVSWSMEGLAYYMVVVGVGATPGLETAAGALFVFSLSAIIGAVIATPGGLGGTEASLVALSQRTLGLERAAATAASLIIRLATLWFGVAIGLVCLARWPELLEGAPADAVSPEAPRTARTSA
jgi:uncharacterized membrane protein YbhN (UPF0104 family)